MIVALTLAVGGPALAGSGNGARGGSGGIGVDQNGGNGGGGGRQSGGSMGSTAPICGRNSRLGPCGIEYLDPPANTCARYKNLRNGRVGVWRLTDPASGAITNELCGNVDPTAGTDQRSKYLTPEDRSAFLLPDGKTGAGGTPGLTGLPSYLVIPAEFTPGQRLGKEAIYLPPTRLLNAAIIELHLVEGPSDVSAEERASGSYSCADGTEDQSAPDTSKFPVGSALRVVAQSADGSGPVFTATTLEDAKPGDVPESVVTNLKAFDLTGDAKLLKFSIEKTGMFKVWLQACWSGSVVQVPKDGSGPITTNRRILYTQLVSNNYVVQDKRSVFTG